MYSADRSFIKDLKNIDRHLDCEYVPKYERFVITYKRAIGEPVPVFIVQTEDNEFRRPDRRDLEKVRECDLEKESIEDKFRRISKQVWEAQFAQQRKASQEFKERALDDKVILSQKFSRLTGIGKGNSAFRRIDVKPKGKKFD